MNSQIASVAFGVVVMPTIHYNEGSRHIFSLRKETHQFYCPVIRRQVIFFSFLFLFFFFSQAIQKFFFLIIILFPSTSPPIAFVLVTIYISLFHVFPPRFLHCPEQSPSQIQVIPLFPDAL